MNIKATYQTYIHTKTGDEYWKHNEVSQVKLNGEWFTSVIYQKANVSVPFYVREISDFEDNFELKK